MKSLLFYNPTTANVDAPYLISFVHDVTLSNYAVLKASDGD